MPGGIDPHVHLHHVWIKPDGTPLVTAGPEQVGRAALYGGTTTFIDFAYWRDGASAQQAIETRDQDFVGKSPCDWAYHIMLHSEPPPEFSGQLAEAIQAGYPTLKIFTTNILPSRTGRMIDFGDIWEAFQVLAKEGGLGVIHAEDNDIVMHMYAKLIREGRVGFENLAEVHNQLSEDLSFRRVLRLAESVPGTALYMMHVSAGTGVAAIAEARAQGAADLRRDAAPVSAATRPRTTSVPNGQIYHTYPSLKSAEDQKALWRRHAERHDPLRRHRRAVLHAARTRPSATASTTPPAAIPASSRGSASCTPRWWCGAAIRCRATSIWSRPTPRRSWGSIRRKGAIAAGSDADITILDPTRRGKVRAADLHETDYTPWEGHDIFAWPVVTILRGKVMVENGQYFGSPSDGRYLKRKISPKILNGAGAVSGVPDRSCARAADAEPRRLARRPASVARAGDGALVICEGRKDIRIEPAPPDLLFRWMVTVDGRKRGAISLVAVLRQVREALDPGYAAQPRAHRGRSAGAVAMIAARSRFRCSPASSAAARRRCSATCCASRNSRAPPSSSTSSARSGSTTS